ncbi:MAG: pitrilysin family protein [Candidatus Nanoarchaeia archaeon]|nr:pitrilysin family protein [Candidatus Nanoarchaeia archaeon]
MERLRVNGLNVVLDKTKGNSVVVLVSVKVGSTYENKNNAGISHLIEHMVFEGTKTRTSQEISKTIEQFGGELNAFTDFEKTVYYVRIAKKHVEPALDILSDVIKNPTFEQKSLEKEKKVVADEINMIFDDPKMYQWFFLLRNLFQKNPVKNPIYGKKETVLNLSRQSVIDFYKKYYVRDNLELIVVGNFNKKRIIKLIKNYFNNIKTGKVLRRNKILEKPLNAKKQCTEIKKTKQSYIVFGFKTVPRTKKDSYVFDVLNAILCRGQSSKLFEEIRTKRGLAYILGSYLEEGSDYGFYGIYVASNIKNLVQIKKIVFDEIQKLKHISSEDLKKAKNYQEGSYLLETEDNEKKGALIASWSLCSNLDGLINYIKQINKVTKEDISRIIDSYMNERNSAIVIIKQV